MTVEQPMEAFYRHARWRSERMSAKMKRRRSEQAFVQRIKEKFGIEGRQLAILYCNWDRDVMGALNIRHAGMHLLAHGVEHPHFMSDS